MFYKLSNTTDILQLEGDFDAKFKYPLLYRTTAIINGLLEESLPVITMETPGVIDYAIWGLLPENYKEGWESFQNLTNTLNTSINDLNSSNWLEEDIKYQRCVVIVSGFFTSYLYNGEIYPFYVYEKDHKPFALAGIYSRLSDGFLSFSLITTPAKKHDIKEIHNLGPDFPIVISSDHYEAWLEYDVDLATFGYGKIGHVDLQAHTISKEFYKNQIMYQTILEPAHYNDFPMATLK
ncbi:SOS response-associated peptidase family protein [Winogradskyella undariae]|uniref:SOS response-associated peptidase family protein n=1 Tax=Winogradskyella undariae TaxID=1285465 RepID=UPI00156ABC52|nr:SOS response-associated peptidase family protein [Winogradskyella undariae]NRR90602.1 SOS response-associated peptidase family protein [Winogradskyella undariae]